jgi:hypothetical protein
MSERDDAREILRELLHEALAGRNGHHAEPAAGVPAVPAPPVAAVLRPSTWSRPPADGELVGGGPDGGTEVVSLDSDDDLQRFVGALLTRFENPRERSAIRAGKVRFVLRRSNGAGRPAGPAGPAAGTVRVDRGAVTERKVEEAAKAGARLVLGPRAVLTPLAREKARARGIEIERER